MSLDRNVAVVASLVADPARASMLATLLDGRACPANELARSAGIGAATASSHLGKLLDCGLLTVEAVGRHRYYRLASAEAAAIGNLVAASPDVPAVPLRLSRSVADPARAAMLVSLLDGRARTAGDLAGVAGVTAPTASSHLRRLLDGGLVGVESTGRNRCFSLAGSAVASGLESLAAVRLPETERSHSQGRTVQELRFARCCFDHLAGRLAVDLTRVMESRGILIATPDKGFEVTSVGHAWFDRLGMGERPAPGRPGRAAIQCLDSTERRPHLAGALGRSFLDLLWSKGWLRRQARSRAVHITVEGWDGFSGLVGGDECSRWRADDPSLSTV